MIYQFINIFVETLTKYTFLICNSAYQLTCFAPFIPHSGEALIILAIKVSAFKVNKSLKEAVKAEYYSLNSSMKKVGFMLYIRKTGGVFFL